MEHYNIYYNRKELIIYVLEVLVKDIKWLVLILIWKEQIKNMHHLNNLIICQKNYQEQIEIFKIFIEIKIGSQIEKMHIKKYQNKQNNQFNYVHLLK